MIFLPILPFALEDATRADFGFFQFIQSRFKKYKFIRNYFWLPLGQIKRCEKYINPLMDQQQQKYFPVTSHLGYQNQLDNCIEIHARDNQRKFLVQFEIS
mmetsp:Transcript_30160/g.46075  ORF Transcript_30160/g.46075 Transcript_30160/m.46075 type:complete len:100 (-) Transcript_30160:1045-1344(-)